jgi:hypothetical protein
MPYKSMAQERYFNANRSKLEKQGVDVDEWNSASKGARLPQRASTPATPHATPGLPSKGGKGNKRGH